LSLEQKRALINPLDSALSVYQQCELLGLARSSYYYEPQPEGEYNLQLMRLIDEQYLRRPFYGSRRMREWLKSQGHRVCRDRVRRLMRLMGIEAIYPKPRLSIKDKEHRIYPYLLRELTIDHADQVWTADITYIRLRRGFAYLIAIMDWYSRYVISWELSLTLETDFCVSALNQALNGRAPEFFNTDQGSQFTSEVFTDKLKKAGIRISMDGRGRIFDNIMIERLWRSVKYEEVYLKDYEDFIDARNGLSAYFLFYNHERPHQSLDFRPPVEIYTGVPRIVSVA
jgi:putative transposase